MKSGPLLRSHVRPSGKPRLSSLWESIYFIVIMICIITCIYLYLYRYLALHRGPSTDYWGIPSVHKKVHVDAGTPPEFKPELTRLGKGDIHELFRFRLPDVAIINRECGLALEENSFEHCNNIGSRGVAHRLHTLGERHSGTNVATQLVLKNFHIVLPSRNQIAREFIWADVAKYREELGLNKHKHDSQVDSGYYEGLSVVSVRNPYDWVHSMMEECYHCALEQLSVVKDPDMFVTVPWTSGAHIAPHESFSNIFDLRQQKICNHIGTAAKRSDCVFFTRAEENLLEEHQQEFVSRVARMTGWEIHHGQPQSLTGYFGRMNRDAFDPIEYLDKSLYFKSNYTPLDAKIIKAVNRMMNADFESALGYDIIHCEN